MKSYQFSLVSLLIVLALAKSGISQPLILKGFLFAIPGDGVSYEVTLGAEVRLWPRISLEALYQKLNEIGDNDYYRNIYLFSGRYYPASKKRFFHNTYLSPAYRYADFTQHPDQSDVPEYYYYTHSSGLLFGKNLNFGKRFLLDLSTGPFVYFSSSAKAIEHDTQNILGSLMVLINDQLGWRTYIKLGFKIGHITD